MVEIAATVTRPPLSPAEQERVFRCTAISRCTPVDGGYEVVLVSESPMRAFDIAHDIFAGDIIVFDETIPYAWRLDALRDDLDRAVAAAQASGQPNFGPAA